MATDKHDLPDELAAAVASDVARELGGDPVELVESKPEVARRDEDDGTNESIRLRALLGSEGSSG